MKFLRFMRHSIKEDNLVTQEGLDLARERAAVPIQGMFTDLFHGPFIRTAQTLLAIATSLGCKGRVHAAIPEIGNEELFKDLLTPDFVGKVKGGMSEWNAFHEAFPDEEVERYSLIFAGAITKIFDIMKDGGVGLAIGHDCIIPIAASRICGSKKTELDYLEYIDFIQDNSGNISLYEV